MQRLLCLMDVGPPCMYCSLPSSKKPLGKLQDGDAECCHDSVLMMAILSFASSALCGLAS